MSGGTTGPAGLLWVRQGNTGLDRKAKAEEENEKQARETVLTSVQGEVESITGGRRMRAILDACESELSKLVTATYKAKSGGPYEAAVTARNGLAERVGQLEIEVNALHDALKERHLIRTRLTELDDPEQLAEMRLAVDAAEKQFEAAKLHAEQHKTAKAETALKKSQRDLAITNRNTFEQTMNRLAAVEKDLEAANDVRKGAINRCEQVRLAQQAANEATDAAEKTERQLREQLAILERAAKAREAADKLEKVREALSQAESLREKIETIEAKIRTRELKEEAVNDIERLEQEMTRLRATQAVKKTTLTMVYGSGIEPSIRIGDDLLPDKLEQALAGPTHLTLPGLGVLAVQPPEFTDDDDISKVEAKYRECLDALGIENLAMARRIQEEVRILRAEVDLSRHKLSIAAPDGLDTLRDSVVGLEAVIQVDIEPTGDLNEVREQLEAADASVVAARLKAAELRPVLEQATNDLVAAEGKAKQLEAEIEQLEAVLGPQDQRLGKWRELNETATQLETELTEAQARLDALVEATINLENAEASLLRARSVLHAQNTDKAQLQNMESELNGRIHAKTGQAIEEDLQEARDQLRIIEEQVTRFEHEVTVLRKLKDTLLTTKGAAREQYFEPVMNELRPLLGLMFDDATITFDDETLLPNAICRNGQQEQIPALSGGMREQMAVLTRLAFARLLARTGRPAPVILDDALVYSDDDRIEKMFDALHRQAREQQIIVFSCRQRAFSRLGGNRLRLSDWTPATP
ncbi:MAG: ATP-binding protein [Asticcacaulis sp.]|uniref:ATP-binding protein n=1 Tax=Asticcacaulis sp. TaxID=1872648 RepID=UPI003F7CA98A